MTDTAFKVQYREEFVAGFEQRQSLLRESVTHEAVINGNQATFLVVDSGGATASTRGINGLIAARADNNAQNTATLAEWHDLVRKSNFNIFGSQGNQRAIMQMTTMAVMNRKIDDDILSALANASTSIGGVGVTASMQLVMQAKTKLGNNKVPWDSNLFAVISPAFEGYLAQTKEFASREYIKGSPVSDGDLAWRDRPLMYYWQGVNWMVHPSLSGVGTTSATCFMYHKSSIGHAIDVAGLDSPVGYNEEQAYSWARCSGNFGGKLLQDTGVVKILHDDSGLS